MTKPIAKASSTNRPVQGKAGAGRQTAVREASQVSEAEPARQSLSGRQLRLDAADMMSTEEAAALTQTSRMTVNAWIHKGRCIGLTRTKRGFRLPRWQFEPRTWEVMGELADALKTTDGWEMLAFLESPHGKLKGLTPKAAIERGEGKKVLQLARAAAGRLVAV